MANNDLVTLLRAQNIEVFNQVATILTENPETIIDLTGADLTGLDLSEARLWRCDLTGANLAGARLCAFVLAGACLRSVNLDGATFVDDQAPVKQVLLLWGDDAEAWNTYRKGQPRVLLSGCMFNGARFAPFDLSEVSFTTGRFIDADLSACVAFDRLSLIGAHLNRANLRSIKGFAIKFQRANLSDAVLDDARLDSPDLTHVQAPNASFRRATLSNVLAEGLRAPNACFDHATLQQALLSEADFTGASFRHATLTGCLLSDTLLRGCVFEDATFSKCSFAGADLDGVRFIRCAGLDLSGARNAEKAEVQA